MLAYEKWLKEAAEGKTEDECHIVQPIPSGARRTSKFNGKGTYMYRIAWILNFGPIPKGMFICHSCDNGNCVNIRHLWLGNHASNMQDFVRKHPGNFSPPKHLHHA